MHALTLALFLLACSGAPKQPDAGGGTLPVEPDGGAGTTPSAQPSPPVLEHLEYADFSERLEAGLSCGFEADPGGQTLLVAVAEDDPGSGLAGVVKEGGEVYILRAPSGGFEALQAGAVLTGGERRVTIERAAGEPRRDAMEVWSWEAVLVAGAMGAESRFTGRWACGS